MRGSWRDLFTDRGLETEHGGVRQRSLARALLVMVIGALCLAALVAIGLLLFGNFGETEGKILLTTLAFAGYSLLGLAATSALGREPTWLGPLGLVVSAIGFVLCVSLIWVGPESELLGRLMGAFLVLGVAIAHASLLRFMTRDVSEGSVVTVRAATLVASSTLSAMIIVLILSGWEPGGVYFRILGVVAVLAVLGSLLVPVLWKLAGGTLAPKAEAPASDQLEVRYKGRTFVVRSGYRAEPPAGFTVEAWEIVNGGREPVREVAGTEPLPDPHGALALAVRNITAAVDSDR